MAIIALTWPGNIRASPLDQGYAQHGSGFVDFAFISEKRILNSQPGGMMQVAITVAIGGYASLTVTASDRFFQIYMLNRAYQDSALRGTDAVVRVQQSGTQAIDAAPPDIQPGAVLWGQSLPPVQWCQTSPATGFACSAERIPAAPA